jgi:hypothetical protein
MYGQSEPESTYLEKLKINEDENPSAELIQTFARGIADEWGEITNKGAPPRPLV